VDRGYVKFYRKSVESRAFQNEGLWKVWSWCLLKANHKECWVPVKTGKGITEVHLKPGQFVFGRGKASKALRMPASSVRNRLALLEKAQNLVIKVDTHYSIITICNWELYQVTENEVRTGKRTGKGQAKDTDKNAKNVEEAFKEPPSQEEINEASIKKIESDTEKVCEELYNKKIFLKVHAFKNKMLKADKNPRAILHVLCRCLIKKPDTPWAYCQKIIGIEDGNFTEKDKTRTV